MRSTLRLTGLLTIVAALSACSAPAHIMDRVVPLENDDIIVRHRNDREAGKPTEAIGETVGEFIAIRSLAPEMQWSRAVRRVLPDLQSPVTGLDDTVMIYAMFSPRGGLMDRKETLAQNIKASGWKRFPELDAVAPLGSQLVFRRNENEKMRLLIITETHAMCDNGATTADQCKSVESAAYLTDPIDVGAASSSRAPSVRRDARILEPGRPALRE